jgi:predicted nucleic acid-binding protein
MNIVLDTNVLVAAGFNPRSDAARVVQAVREGRLTLVWNDATRDETRRILDKIPPLDWQRFADLYDAACRYDGRTEPDRFERLDGPLDRQFAALADAAGALLVSNDDDLLSVRHDLPVTVMPSGEFADHHLPAR